MTDLRRYTDRSIRLIVLARISIGQVLQNIHTALSGPNARVFSLLRIPESNVARFHVCKVDPEFLEFR